jgi:hypothetical protein
MIMARKELQVVNFRELARLKKGFRCQVSGVSKQILELLNPDT